MDILCGVLLYFTPKDKQKQNKNKTVDASYWG